MNNMFGNAVQNNVYFKYVRGLVYEKNLPIIKYTYCTSLDKYNLIYKLTANIG